MSWTNKIYRYRYKLLLLEKDGEGQLDRLCVKESITYSQGGEEYPTYNKNKER